MKRCIIYARIGGPASEVNNSLMQAQLAGLRTTAKGLGLEVVAELPVFEYGTDGNRQSIKTLARDIFQCEEYSFSEACPYQDKQKNLIGMSTC